MPDAVRASAPRVTGKRAIGADARLRTIERSGRRHASDSWKQGGHYRRKIGFGCDCIQQKRIRTGMGIASVIDHALQYASRIPTDMHAGCRCLPIKPERSSLFQGATMLLEQLQQPGFLRKHETDADALFRGQRRIADQQRVEFADDLLQALTHLPHALDA